MNSDEIRKEFINKTKLNITTTYLRNGRTWRDEYVDFLEKKVSELHKNTISENLSNKVLDPSWCNGIATGNLAFLMFPDENKIRFWQDFSGWEGIPSDRRFYPKEETNGSIVFIADGYGITGNNKWNLGGKYGNGAIYVSVECLPADVVEWCRSNFL